MLWRFYLIDRSNVKTRIEEPSGWDSLVFRIKRHAERHGTFREVSASEFKFFGVGKDKLKAEYDQYGARGIYTLLIEGKCGNGYQEMYQGQISFDTYQFNCGDYCYVSANVDQVGPLVDFINRFDQKVDLSSSTAFDGAALTNYAALNKTLLLPSKAILLRGNAKNASSHEYKLSDDSGWFPVSSTGTLQGGINIVFDTTEVSAIKDFKPDVLLDFFNKSNYNEYIPELIYNNPTQVLSCNGEVFNLDFRVKGVYKNLLAGSGTHTLTLVLKKGTTDFYSATTITAWTIHTASDNNVLTFAFDQSFTGTVNLAQGEKLWLDLFLTYFKSTSYTADVRIQIDPETYFKSSVVSKCEDTTAKVSLLNEVVSRVTESITNNQLQVYSSYYGRVNSEPYAMVANGCGALRAITTGLDVRKAKLSDGSDPKMFLSMKDVFEALSSIDNIGVGPEDDDKIRLENWKYFYQDEVVFTCRDIQTLTRKAKSEDLYSTFKNGYEKWGSEDYDGLDELLTKREWRTALSNVQNDFEKVCKWIASGYAWEETRRLGPNSKDWRFDNDTFIICLNDFFKGSANFTSATNSFNIIPEQDGLIAIGNTIVVSGTTSNNGTYTVSNVVQIANSIQVYVTGTFVNEVAANAIIKNTTTPFYTVEVKSITSGVNILDPDTVYNFRISPERNAMRWFDFIAKCYKNITSADKLIFTSGDGNFLATGNLIDTAGCKLESGTLTENGDISLASFADADNGTPITEPDRVVYKYALSFTEYNLIKANSNKLIKYIAPCEQGEGWIDEIAYSPKDGTATFTLIPKVS